MIEVRVLDIRPHPDQATNNPGSWAVRLSVSYDGTTRSFWRWYTVRAQKDGHYITPPSTKPSRAEIIKTFWDDTFAEVCGFSFNKDDP
jgi:hypothetical protein